jgi:hypothetical protein
MLLQEMPEVPEIPEDPSTADATTVVYSKRGVVAVADYKGNQGPPQKQTAGITSEAYNAEVNTALTGVVAGSELDVDDVFSDEPPTTLLSSLLYDFQDDLSDMLGFDIVDEYFTPGSVYVLGLGSNGHAKILSEATNGIANNAETVVAAPGKVVVIADNLCDEYGMPSAQIKSKAGWDDDYNHINTALTRVYSSEVYVDVPSAARGRGIWAYAENSGANPRVPGSFLINEGILSEPYTGEYYSLQDHGEVVYTGENEETGSSATLIIQDYSEAVDLPDCPECPCTIDEPIEPPIGPPAPLATAPIPGLQEVDFLQGGCPALMQWLASEIGVDVDVQVFLANSFVSSTDCQPCETAARLKAAATVLADEGGSYMAAMNQVFNELAPADAPLTPEMANSIVTAFAGRVNDGTQYATAIEYIDAFVQYIAILNSELGSPVEDSVAYVMEKYGSGVTGSENANIAAFLATRMQSGETFTQ